MANKKLENISTEELEKMLEKRKRIEADEREKHKAQYEAQRDELVLDYSQDAISLAHDLQEFKEELDHQMEVQAERLRDYGEMRANSKGGFSITNEKGQYKITRRRNTSPAWDERADKAEGLLQDFFKDTVKKRDKKLAEILMSYLSKNKDGALRYSSVMKLMQHRDKFTDKRWLEALRLLQESYNSGFTKYYYEFYLKGESGEWEKINLNFSSI